MKAKFLVLMFVVAAGTIAAQKEERSSKQLKIVIEGSAVKDTTIKGNQDDTLHIRLGDMKIDIYPDSTSRLITTDKKCKSLPIEDFPWYGFEGFRFGFLTFTDANQNSYQPEWLQNQGKRNSSGYLGIGIINTSFELIEDRFRLGTGLGLTWETIAINRNLRLAEADTFGFQTVPFPVSELATMNSSYLTVPLVFQYNGKVTEQDREDLWMNQERNIFHVSFGIIGGYRISSSALYKWKENGDKRKQRVAGDFGVNDYMLNLYVEAGFTSSLSFFLESGLLPKFSNGQGPEISSNAFGIKLNF
jgi:hypothetical protein